MPRVGTCKDCGARFKVPDSTTATRAKCSKCGGIVEIAAAAAGAAGAAPKRTGPSPVPRKATAGVKAPARSAGAAARAPRTRKGSPDAGERAAPRRGGASKKRPGGRRGAAGGSRRSRGGGKDGQKSKSKAGLWAAIVLVVGVGGFATWWFGFREDPASSAAGAAGATPTDGKTDGVQPETGTPAASDAGSGADAATPPDAGGDTDAATPPNAGSGTDAAPPPGGAGATDADFAGIEKAPAPVAADDTQPAKDAPEEALPTLIEFEPLPPIIGTTEDQLAEWTDLVSEVYFVEGGLTGRRRSKGLEKLRALDTFESIPAYINATNGIDLADTDMVMGAFKLVEDWQKRVANKPTFSFPGEIGRMDTKTQNLRVKVINLWRTWWINERASGTDQDTLDAYRLVVTEALKQKGG